MKTSGHGGCVYFDSVLVAQARSWSLSEDPGILDQDDSTLTSGDIELIFYDGFDQHKITIGSRLEIEIKPHGAAVINWVVSGARITGRSVNASATTMVAGSLSFESHSPVVYP